jgi:hypothetical protein
MAKSPPADALLKRLQKVEQAHARLVEAAARVRAQADTVADLVKLAQALVSERATRAPGAKVATKRAPAKPAGGSKAAPVRRTASRRSPSASAATPAKPAAPRRRKPAARRRKPASRPTGA